MAIRFTPVSFVLALAVCLGSPCLLAAAKPPAAKPAYSVPLEPLGYRPVTSSMLLTNGFAHTTIDFIDNDHVLVTFGAHKLIPRERDDPERDMDRLIKAVVLHLPDGAVVREAEWRVHDQSRYLWPLTHGRFLLRERNELSWVDPMRAHPSMHRHSMLMPDGELAAVQVSPDGETVLVQTTPKQHIGDDPTQPLDHAPVTLTFYRVTSGDEPKLHKFGSTEAEHVVALPFTSHGVLSLEQEDRQHWGFDFHPFSGGKMELAGLTSLCRPEVEFVSEATFVASGCRGLDDRRLLSGFDLLAQPNWVFTTDDPPLWSAISAASGDTGRFAFRNATESAGVVSRDEDDVTDHHAQTVRVYEFQGGKELLRVSVAPAQRAALNFDLSPDGLKLAVLQGRNLEIYTLPPLSPENRREEAREEEAVRKIQVPKSFELRVHEDPTDGHKPEDAKP